MPPAKHTQAQLKGKAGTEPAPQGSAMHTPQHESEASGKMPAGPPRHGHAGIRGNASEEQPTPPPPTREGWLLGSLRAKQLQGLQHQRQVVPLESWCRQ